MALLSDADLKDVMDDFLDKAREYGIIVPGMLRAEVWTMFQALNTETENNQTALNLWFPQPARSALPLRAKAYALAKLLEKRAVRTS